MAPLVWNGAIVSLTIERQGFLWQDPAPNTPELVIGQGALVAEELEVAEADRRERLVGVDFVWVAHRERTGEVRRGATDDWEQVGAHGCR